MLFSEIIFFFILQQVTDQNPDNEKKEKVSFIQIV